jgi:transglutaminase-like putative cysteine protease
MKSIAVPAPLRQPSTPTAALVGAGSALVRSPLFLRAVGFAALASFAMARWVTLVSDPPAARAIAAIAIATFGGIAIARVSEGGSHARATAARVGILVLAIAAALVVMGLPLRLLGPRGWDEFGAGIGQASAAFQISEWPYAGPDEWIRLGTLLVAPPVICLAGALAFWPTRGERSAPVALAAATLVGLYAAAIAQGQPHAPLVAGLLLLSGVAALLFLPQARGAPALPAMAMLLVAAAVAVPLAARLPASTPLINYNTIVAGDTASFDWDHTYGPLDWPRKGELVFKVSSDAPHYWKATTLDHFDGFRWVTSTTSVGAPGSELPDGPTPSSWETEATLTIGALQGDLLISPGPILNTNGLDTIAIADDGTASTADDLGAGDGYSVHAYTPDPSPGRMRAAPARVPREVAPYTSVTVPVDYSLDSPPPGQVNASLAAPNLRLPPIHSGFGPRTPAVERMLESPYARTYKLARQLGAGAPTTYDAVLRIQEYLRSTYRYDERPPARKYPLQAFLFQDGIGYCQQFSGAMALLLRMNGIPARVAAGFASGTQDGRNTYAVRDTDAHSWVEVWFEGIGWVPFDPTPAAAPAVAGGATAEPTAQLGAEGASAQLRRAGRHIGDAQLHPNGIGPSRGNGSAAAPKASKETRAAAAGPPMRALALALAALGVVALARWSWRQRARLAGLSEVDEIREAFALTGEPVRGATLLELEQSLSRRGHQGAARYLADLRAHRYAPRSAPRPGRRARRALRTAISRGKGPAGHARAWLALPPRLHRR